MKKLDDISWKKFRVDEIFKISRSKKAFNAKDIEIFNESCEGRHPYVVRSSQNNGIKGYISAEESFLNAGGTISFACDTAKVFYQERPYFTGGNMKVYSLLDSNVRMTEEIGMFLCCLLSKAYSSFLWGMSFTDDKIGAIEIHLPVTEDGIPNWKYMRERIAELERERIAELERYLVVAGLNDHLLTENDLNIIALSKRMEKFRISDIFNLKKGKRLTKAEHTEGDTPFIGSTSGNNGITGHIGQEPIFEGNAITVSYNGSVGQVFYQENPFWASDDVNVLYLKGPELNRELFGYLGTSLRKAGKSFSYGFKWNIERMRGTMISLPIRTDISGIPIVDENHGYHPDGFVPDWKYMERYIKAIEKLVIKDVVNYKNEFIAKAKDIAGRDAKVQ